MALAPDAQQFVEVLRPAVRQAAAIARALEGRVPNTPKRGEVTDVKAKYSYAKPLGLDVSALKTGDRVVSTQKPAGLEFASSWVAPGKSK